MTSRKLISEFNNACYNKNNNIYIQYSVLSGILHEILNNRDKLLAESLEDFSELSRIIIEFFAKIKFWDAGDILKNAQKTYNGIYVFEQAIVEGYKDYIEFNGEDEDNHTCMHTGCGLLGSDFVIKKNLVLSCIDSLHNFKVVELSAKTEVDSKSYISRDRMDEALMKNKNGKLGHFGQFLIVYTILERSWYLVDNWTNEVLTLVDFHPKFQSSLLKFSIDNNNLLKVSNFN